MDQERYSETGKRPDNESTEQSGAMDEAANAGQTDAGWGGSAYQPGQQPARADQPEDQTEDDASHHQPAQSEKAGGTMSRPAGEGL